MSCLSYQAFIIISPFPLSNAPLNNWVPIFQLKMGIQLRIYTSIVYLSLISPPVPHLGTNEPRNSHPPSKRNDPSEFQPPLKHPKKKNSTHNYINSDHIWFCVLVAKFVEIGRLIRDTTIHDNVLRCIQYLLG